MQGFEFCCPTKIVCGAHALDKLPDEVADRGMKHPLVMTDAGLVKLGVAAKLTGVLDAADVPYEVFDQVPPDSSMDVVIEVARLYAERGCDGFVAIGGGSVIDTTKGAAASLAGEGVDFAPLQGYTDAVYRRAHARIFGGIETYYSPFVRMEHGEIRRKDARDIEPDNNPDLHLIPQLIAPDADKLEHIMSLFIEKGYQEADINLGCPFPMLARRHNGCGMLPYPEEVKALLSEAIDRHPDIRFSVKLRLGWEQAEECLALLPLFNELPLAHIILHPRLGKQQ